MLKLEIDLVERHRLFREAIYFCNYSLKDLYEAKFEQKLFKHKKQCLAKLFYFTVCPPTASKWVINIVHTFLGQWTCDTILYHILIENNAIIVPYDKTYFLYMYSFIRFEELDKPCEMTFVINWFRFISTVPFHINCFRFISTASGFYRMLCYNVIACQFEVIQQIPGKYTSIYSFWYKTEES